MQHRELTTVASNRFLYRSLSGALCVLAIVLMSHVCMAPNVFRIYRRHDHRLHRRSRQWNKTDAPEHGYEGYPPRNFRPERVLQFHKPVARHLQALGVIHRVQRFSAIEHDPAREYVLDRQYCTASWVG